MLLISCTQSMREFGGVLAANNLHFLVLDEVNVKESVFVDEEWVSGMFLMKIIQCFQLILTNRQEITQISYY